MHLSDKSRNEEDCNILPVNWWICLSADQYDVANVLYEKATSIFDRYLGILAYHYLFVKIKEQVPSKNRNRFEKCVELWKYDSLS